MNRRPIIKNCAHAFFRYIGIASPCDSNLVIIMEDLALRRYVGNGCPVFDKVQ